MSSFGFSAVAGGVGSALFGTNKGMVNNRINCAGAQLKNDAVNLAQMAAVGGSVAGITYAAAKSPKFANLVMKGLNGVKTLMGKTKFTGKIASTITTALSKFSKTGKIGAALTLAALPLLYLIDHKHSYRMGQIDQEYTDRAAVQDKMNDMVSIGSLR